MPPNERLMMVGGNVKHISTNDDTARIGGYLVRFGSPDSVDTDGDFFTPATDFGTHQTSVVLYNHGLDDRLGLTTLDDSATLKRDLVGIWIEAQLNLRDQWHRAIYELAEKGKLSWSSGTAKHLVRRQREGRAHRITRWHLGLDASLTPTPADVQTVAIAMKSLPNLSLPQPPTPSPIGEGELNGLSKREFEEENYPITKAKNEFAVGCNSSTKISHTDHKTQQIRGEIKMTEENTVQDEVIMEPALVQTIVEQVAQRVSEQVSQQVESRFAEMTSAGGGVQVGNIKRVTSLGFRDDATQSFMHWIKTGDYGAIKAALQEDTNTEGGYLVPNDFSKQIIGKRNEFSIPRILPNLTRLSTSSKQVDIPVESSSGLVFGITSEEASYDEVEPTFTQKQVTVHKFTRKLVMSEELEADEGAGLQEFLANWVGHAVARTENQYFITGTGSSQPEGITVGGTSALTLANTDSIVASEIPDMVATLGAEYLDGAVWMMRRATEHSIRALQGNQFLFATTPQGGNRELWGYSVFNSDQVPAMATSAKSLIFMNPAYYAWVDRGGLTVQRDPYSSADTGQIVLRWSFRFGGAVLLADAVNYAVQAAS